MENKIPLKEWLATFNKDYSLLSDANRKGRIRAEVKKRELLEAWELRKIKRILSID